MAEEYLNRLKEYDTYLETEITGANKSISNLSELVSRGAIVGESTIAEAIEKLHNYNSSRIRLYDIFPELKEFSKISENNSSNDFEKNKEKTE